MRICRTCKRTIRRDEGCFEVPPHHDPDGPAPGFYCADHASIEHTVPVIPVVTIP